MSRQKFMNKALMYQYDKELASAFQADCEIFLDEFEKYQSFRFMDFQQVWHQQKFSFIFAGQVYALLLRDFCENCFYVVKKYIMFPRTLYTQIGAFYLLYSIYYKQPLRTWVKIRLTFDEYQKLYELITEMSHRQQIDVCYIFSKMQSEGAFLYVAHRKPLGPEDRFVKDVQMYINDTFTYSKTQSAITKFKDLQDKSGLISEIESTNKEYSELLQKYAGKCSQLKPFSSTLIDEIQAAYTNFQNDGKNSNSNEGTTVKKSEIQTSKHSIKNKAMLNKNAVYRASKKVKTAVDTTDESDSN
ncbi:snRNA-activating protein complex subunit 1-like isoform X1 [Diorhabda sublineata]|uniref:snRNA-activating protein complex subunit 1-like isoform X1 n=1 Tax=Diorhabda sublineata TaxID=1163346 RepID=UPI0024E042F2|nr:snRNA-activating protein complex subunit 1-like isoform X1 [Diorhabda sublineata]